MTDHTAIVERMAGELFPYAFMPMSVHHSKLRRQQLIDEAMERTQTALTASGLLEVLEKADQLQGSVIVAHGFIHKGQSDKADREFMANNLADEARAVRNAIKGVRDGK